MPPDLVSALHEALAPIDAVRVAYVFGSQVTGRAGPRSDLDVAVLWDRSFDDMRRERARRDVLDALADRLGALGERADIVDIDRCASAVAFKAIAEGRRVLARDDGERVQLEAHVMRRYDDDAPRRALYRRAAVLAAKGAHR
jgi:hypothetical protein